MNRARADAVTPPAGDPLAARAAPGDYVDCYAIRTATPGAPIADIARTVLTDLPPWCRALLAVRDAGACAAGLKTTIRLAHRGYAADSDEFINFFRVREIAENAIVLGEDDMHLDFRIALHRAQPYTDSIYLTTWVHPHNLMGRVYLRSVLPFHGHVVGAMLARLA